MTTQTAERPALATGLQLADVVPGVTLLVPSGADVIRKGKYRLQVLKVEPKQCAPEYVSVHGATLNADGSVPKRYRHRWAILRLAQIAIAP